MDDECNNNNIILVVGHIQCASDATLYYYTRDFFIFPARTRVYIYYTLNESTIIDRACTQSINELLFINNNIMI